MRGHQVLWDSGSNVQTYSRKMSAGGAWGGGIEMAALSHLQRVNVFVYQKCASGYERISSFEGPGGGGKVTHTRLDPLQP